MRAASALPALLVGALLGTSPGCGGRADRKTPDEIRGEIAALERERDELRAKIGELIAEDPRLAGMPEQPVRIGVPTALARQLITKLTTGFVDKITLELKNIRVKKKGTVKKMVTLGDYNLEVLITRISAALMTGEPDVRFGGDRIKLGLPVHVKSGTGQATIHFVWEGKGAPGAVCGDLDVTQDVSGRARPDDYPVAGALQLTATAEQIRAAPKFGVVRIKVSVEPSEQSWADVQKILGTKGGVCGFVLDKVNIPKVLKGLLDRGFNIRLPTEEIKPVALPVGVQPTMDVRGQTMTVAAKVGHLKITEHMIWLGAEVAIDVGNEG
jgi:hypothetical protein